mmetsp:Transcript_8062/g.15857  ORF Transcript_8062/g.15857 Transcript_8062/m.15857 type:complete len:263 (-) Transcript_8062:3277-4065(-)
MAAIHPPRSQSQAPSPVCIPARDSVEFVKSATLRSQDLASALVSPKSRLSFKPGATGFSFSSVPGFIANQQLPSQEDLFRYTHTFIPSKKRSPEASPDPRPASRPSRAEITDVGRITLHRARTGEHLGSPWFPDVRTVPMDAGGATRYSSRPSGYNQTYHKLFPTNKLSFSKMPTTKSQRFGKINPAEDPDLANFVVKAENAFKTTWRKQNDLKDRKFFPEQHEEFTGQTSEHYRKRDRIVEYREAMLKVKSMMNTAWGGKK